MRPLKVKFYLSRPVLATRLLTLDKLVAAVLFGRGKKNEKYNDSVLREVFAEKDGIFASSVFFAETPVSYTFHYLTLSPKRSRKYYDYGTGGKTPKAITDGTGSGLRKSWHSETILFYTNYLYFYTYADKEKLYSILKKVKTIGKKGHFGHGSVKGVEIEEIDEDKSFFLNDYTPSRPLPVTWDIKSNKVILYNVKGASWDRAGVEPCVVPPLSIGERTYKEADCIYYYETPSSSEFMAKYHSDLFMFDSKKLHIEDNNNKKPCAICGIIAKKGITIKNSKSIKNIASSNFTDYRNINPNTSDFICEYCAKGLANSHKVLTRSTTIITPEEVRSKNAQYFSLITNIPKSEYIYLYMVGRGIQKHLLIGSLPSISSIIAVNYSEHNINFIDPDIIKESSKIIKDYSSFQSLNGFPKRDNLDAWKEYSLLINAEHARVINYISKKSLLELSEEK